MTTCIVIYGILHVVITYKKPVTLIYLTSAFYILRKNLNYTLRN